MNEPKLSNAIPGIASTWGAWLLALSTWTGAHVGQISFGFAILASVYTILEAREGRRLKRAQRRHIEEKQKHEKK